MGFECSKQTSESNKNVMDSILRDDLKEDSITIIKNKKNKQYKSDRSTSETNKNIMDSILRDASSIFRISTLNG